MKYSGISLIFIGIILIFSVMFFAVQIFIQEKEPPKIFKESEIMISDIIGGLPIKSQDGSEDLEVAIGEDVELEEVFPISRMLNVFAFSVFAFIIFSGGAKLTKTGVNIVKELS